MEHYAPFFYLYRRNHSYESLVPSIAIGKMRENGFTDYISGFTEKTEILV